MYRWFVLHQRRRPQPLWETYQGIGSHISPEMLKGKMHFLLPGEWYDLPTVDFSLLDRIARGDVTPLMPGCNAYGLQGNEFLDPPPVPRATVRGRSWMAVGPPYGDFSPDEPGIFMTRMRERRAQRSRTAPLPPRPPRGGGDARETRRRWGGAAPRAASSSESAGGAEIKGRDRKPPTSDSYRRWR